MWKFLKDIFNAPPYSPQERIRTTTHLVPPPMPPCKPPRVECKEALRLAAGDVLVLTCERHLSAEQVANIKANSEPYLPEGCAVMVLHGGLKLDATITGDALLAEVKVLRADLMRILDGGAPMNVSVSA